MSSTVGPTNFAPDVAPGAASMKLEAPNVVAPERRMLPVLVATDGRADACGAVRAAARVAVQLDGVPQLMAVLEPVPTYGARIDPAVLDAIETDRARATREAMLAQLHAEIGPDATWPAQVAFGSTARTLAEVAAERRAQLTVIGLGAHRLSDRIFGTETALQTLRMSSGPVLAVPDGADGTFRRAVAAIDFSPASMRAAELACRLLAPRGTLSLVHVKSRLELSQPAWEAWDVATGRRVAELFQHLVAALRARKDVTIGTAILVGDPVDEIIDYAAQVGADLLATGSSGPGFVERLFVGSVASDLIRRATCAVLASPAPTPTEAAHLERRLLGTTESLDAAEWPRLLTEFTARNAGRRTTLEIDDPSVGAQAVERGYALVGAAYDPHDDQVELMLGSPFDQRRHLTRSMTDVASIALLTGPDGKDVALRVAHGGGQTVMTFE